MNPLTLIKSSKVFQENGKAWTTSLFVAEDFEKAHKNVLRSIDDLDCSDKFRQLNFEPSSYINQQNKEQPMYKMTRDGFTFLAMGFTGETASEAGVASSERDASRQIAEQTGETEQAVRMRIQKGRKKAALVEQPTLTESDQKFIVKEAKDIKKQRRKQREIQREATRSRNSEKRSYG